MQVLIANQSSSNQTGKINCELREGIEIFFSGLRSRSCDLIKNARTRECQSKGPQRVHTNPREPANLIKKRESCEESLARFSTTIFCSTILSYACENKCKRNYFVEDLLSFIFPQLYVRKHKGYRVLQHTAFGISFGFVLVPGPPPLTTIGWGQGIVPE